MKLYQLMKFLKWLLFKIKILLRMSSVQKSLEDVELNINKLAVDASTIDKLISNLKRGMNVSQTTIDNDKKKLKLDIQDVIHTLEKIKIKVDSM